MITTGTPLPAFSLESDTGELMTAESFKGHTSVLYFYPKDDTPGCTEEACSLRDSYGEFEKLGVAVVGVSTDSVRSHQKFKQKYHLPFTLLSDPEHTLCEAMGVWGEKTMFGKKYMGILRTTFIVDEKGVVAEVFQNVDPTGHGKGILSYLVNSRKDN